MRTRLITCFHLRRVTLAIPMWWVTLAVAGTLPPAEAAAWVALDALEAPDLIIMDPPRDGINPKALKKIIDYGVKNMVYVSCKPESLARDLEMLRYTGYEVLRSVAVDQFPWTQNVETVCLLSRTGKKQGSDDSGREITDR